MERLRFVITWWLTSFCHCIHCSYIINVFLLIYQLGTCCVYVVFISSNIKGIVDLYTEEKVDVRLIMVILLLPLIFLNWVRGAGCVINDKKKSILTTIIRFAISSFWPHWVLSPTLSRWSASGSSCTTFSKHLLLLKTSKLSDQSRTFPSSLEQSSSPWRPLEW